MNTTTTAATQPEAMKGTLLFFSPSIFHLCTPLPTRFSTISPPSLSRLRSSYRDLFNIRMQRDALFSSLSIFSPLLFLSLSLAFIIVPLLDCKLFNLILILGFTIWEKSKHNFLKAIRKPRDHQDTKTSRHTKQCMVRVGYLLIGLLFPHYFSCPEALNVVRLTSCLF